MRLKKYREFSRINEEYGYNPFEDECEMSEPEKRPETNAFVTVEWEKGKDEAILKNKTDNNLYLFLFPDVERSEFWQYAELPTYTENDEDGRTKVRDTDSFEMDKYVIADYVNDNFDSFDYGEGVEDYEAGQCNFILIDEPLKVMLREELGFNLA